MLFYEDPDSVKSFDAAVEYVKNNPALGYSTGEIWRIQSNGTDGSKLITSCNNDLLKKGIKIRMIFIMFLNINVK